MSAADPRRPGPGHRAQAGWAELLAAAAPVLALALALSPLLGPSYGHDVNAHLSRIAQWHRGVAEGVLYPRFVHDVHWGFGGPVMLFQPPLPYFVTEVFVLLGAGPLRALQLGLALGLAAGVLAAYALARPVLGRAGAAIAAAAYALVPYRLLDAWVRAAYPEMIATALLPLLLLAARRAGADEGPRAWTGVAALTGLLLLTHAPTSLFGVPLAVAYGIWSARDRRPALRLVLAAALGFGLAAFFLVPATLERVHTEFERSVGSASYFYYGNHFVEPRQLWDTRWGFGESGPGAQDAMSFQLGRVHWIGLLGGLLLAWRGPRPLRRELLFWLAASAGAIYMTTPYSAWLWRVVPILHPVQFPWRLLLVPALACSLLLGALAAAGENGPRFLQGAVVAGLLAALALGYAPYATAQRPPPGLDARMTAEGLQGWTGAHWVWLPRGAHPSPVPGPRLEAVAGSAAVRLLEDRTHALTAAVRADGPATLRARILDFPGWRASVDGARAAVRPDPQTGAILVDVPGGEHELRLRFGTTPPRTAGIVISCASLALLGAGLARRPRLAAEPRRPAA